MLRGNFLWEIISNPATDIHHDLAPFTAVAGNTPQLIDAVDQALLYGRMPQAMRQSLANAIVAQSDNTSRVQTALYLTALSGLLRSPVLRRGEHHDNIRYTSRRNFLRIGGAFATAAGFSRFGMMNAFAQSAPNYKALVCIFLFGGNDSHNMVVPQSQAAFNAYKAIRGSLALPDGNAKLLPVSAAERNALRAQRRSGFHRRRCGRRRSWRPWPTSACWCSPPRGRNISPERSRVPTNLFSHADQVIADAGGQSESARAAPAGRAAWPTRCNR